jgi:hypothetical protein
MATDVRLDRTRSRLLPQVGERARLRGGLELAAARFHWDAPGEALAQRRPDVDLDPGQVDVRRSVGVVTRKGQSERLVHGVTKAGQSRVLDLGAGTVAALRALQAMTVLPAPGGATRTPDSAWRVVVCGLLFGVEVGGEPEVLGLAGSASVGQLQAAAGLLNEVGEPVLQAAGEKQDR